MHDAQTQQGEMLHSSGALPTDMHMHRSRLKKQIGADVNLLDHAPYLSVLTVTIDLWSISSVTL